VTSGDLQSHEIARIKTIGYREASDHVICHYDLPSPNSGAVVMYRKRHGYIDVFIVTGSGEVDGPRTYHQSRARR